MSWLPLRRDSKQRHPGHLYPHSLREQNSGVISSSHVFECHRSLWPLLGKESSVLALGSGSCTPRAQPAAHAALARPAACTGCIPQQVYLILGFSVYFHVNHIQVMKVFLVYIQIFNKFINLSVIVSETPIPCFPNYILKCCIPHFHFQVASCLRNAQILKIRVFSNNLCYYFRTEKS